MRTATVGMGGQRLLAILTAMAVITSLMVVLATPAQAHTPDVDEDCYGWSVELLYYNTSQDNSLKIWIDGVLEVDDSDFGASEYVSGSWDPTLNHTIKVDVTAWDDPGYSKGWSFVYEAGSQACVSTTTSTTLPPTTTTLPPTTTTTLPDRFACVDGVVVTVGPDDEGYAEAYDTKEAADADPACQPTTTTLPPTTTTTEPEVEGTVVTTAPTTVPTTVPEVEGTVVTTTPTTEPEELPFTGIDSSTLIGASVVLLGLGALLLTVTRRQESN
jgi:hypothetical protein